MNRCTLLSGARSLALLQALRSYRRIGPSWWSISRGFCEEDGDDEMWADGEMWRE